jgi:TolA-binding protein
LLEQAGRRDEALAVYTNALPAGLPAEFVRHALLKVSELSLSLGKTAEAGQALENFLTQFPTNECSDLALLTLGELRLRQYGWGSTVTNQFGVVTTNASSSTNLLQQAITSFRSFGTSFPQSPLAGKAQLDLGWCYWLGGDIRESQSAFQRAVDLLPPSVDRAQALFKLADAQFELTNYLAAITNYGAVVERFNDLPEVQTNLVERALFQIVRASQAANDDANETNALAKIMTGFPAGQYTQLAVLLAGQHGGERFPLVARTLFSEVARSSTNSQLMPEIQLAIARTYEQQSNWEEAIQQYDAWLATFTNHPSQARAEYMRARANDEAGRETNALVQFTNMVARFPNSDYAPLAQLWVADYYYGLGNPQEAGINYSFLFATWPNSPLAYRARMMAGRAAVVRQDWEHAPEYFLSLANDPKCPTNLQAQALFAYGDTFLSRNNTNKDNDYKEAFNVFDRVSKIFTNDPIAALAWGQKAICLLQTARASQNYASVTNA